MKQPKKKPRRVIAHCDGLKLKRAVMQALKINEEQWFEIYARWKRQGVILGLVTEEQPAK